MIALTVMLIAVGAVLAALGTAGYARRFLGRFGLPSAWSTIRCTDDLARSNGRPISSSVNPCALSASDAPPRTAAIGGR